MKKYALIALLLLVSMALCPLAAMGSRADGKKEQTVPVISQDIIGQTEYITVMSSATGGMQKIGMREYLIGCVAAVTGEDTFAARTDSVALETEVKLIRTAAAFLGRQLES